MVTGEHVCQFPFARYFLLYEDSGENLKIYNKVLKVHSVILYEHMNE
jgi:hypothetical protein